MGELDHSHTLSGANDVAVMQRFYGYKIDGGRMVLKTTMGLHIDDVRIMVFFPYQS